MVLVLSAATASAQSLFVQGTVGADIKRFSGEAGTSVFDGTARVFALAAGGHVTPHWTLLAELDVSGETSQTTTTTVAISGQPRDIHNRYTSDRRGLCGSCRLRDIAPFGCAARVLRRSQFQHLPA